MFASVLTSRIRHVPCQNLMIFQVLKQYSVVAAPWCYPNNCNKYFLIHIFQRDLHVRFRVFFWLKTISSQDLKMVWEKKWFVQTHGGQVPANSKIPRLLHFKFIGFSSFFNFCKMILVKNSCNKESETNSFRFTERFSVNLINFIAFSILHWNRLWPIGSIESFPSKFWFQHFKLWWRYLWGKF